MKTYLNLIILFLIMLIVAGCGIRTPANSAVPPATVTLQSINILPNNNYIQASTTQQYTAYGQYSDWTTKDITTSVLWASSNLAVASVSSTGLVSAIAIGSTSLTASLNGMQNTLNLTVDLTATPPQPPTISWFTPAGALVGASVTIYGSNFDPVPSNNIVKFNNIQAVVTSATATSIMTTVPAGAATGPITITTPYGITTSMNFTVVTLSSITISGISTIPLNGSQSFVATGGYSDWTTANISSQATWSSSNPSIAIVASGGIVTGIASGTAIMTASYKGITSNPIIVSVLNLKILNIPANDLIYNSLNQKIYASIPGTASGGIGNSILIIDPVTGVTGPSLFIGNEPSKLALSDDGKFLYVALAGLNAVQRVNVSTLTPTLDIQFSLGTDTSLGFGPLSLYAGDIAVMPGNNQTVVISKRLSGVSPSFGGVSVYDNGISRPVSIPSWMTSLGTACIDAIQFSNTSTTIYGYDQETSASNLYTMTVNASGIAIASTAATGIITNIVVEMKYTVGNIYMGTGIVINPVTSLVTGTFALPQIMYAMNFVCPDSAVGKVYFFTYNSAFSAQYVLSSYDSNTYALLNSTPITNIPNASYMTSVGSFIKCGPNMLAFRTRDTLSNTAVICIVSPF